MKLRNIFILTLLMLITLSVTAQNQDKNGRGGFNFEELKKEKAAFLKKELNLTETEANAFLPLEAEFTQKKFEINRDARRQTWELRRKENKTDEDFQKITKINLQAEQNESQLQIEYYQKFSNVLSAEKIEKYRRADIKFKEATLKRHQREHPKRDTKKQ